MCLDTLHFTVFHSFTFFGNKTNMHLLHNTVFSVFVSVLCFTIIVTVVKFIQNFKQSTGLKVLQTFICDV